MNLNSLISEFRLYICNNWISYIPSHSVRLFFYKKVMKFKIGKGSYIFMGCKFDCAKGLTIGKNSVVNANCRIDNRGGIVIGENVSISNDVIILTADHDMNNNMKGRQNGVIIENYVWIGTRAMIMPGVKLLHGSVIGASALVNKDVEALTVVGGIPAKVLKKRIPSFDYNASFKRLLQ